MTQKDILYFNGKAPANADVHLTESRYHATMHALVGGDFHASSRILIDRLQQLQCSFMTHF